MTLSRGLLLCRLNVIVKAFSKRDELVAIKKVPNLQWSEGKGAIKVRPCPDEFPLCERKIPKNSLLLERKNKQKPQQMGVKASGFIRGGEQTRQCCPPDTGVRVMKNI